MQVVMKRKLWWLFGLVDYGEVRWLRSLIEHGVVIEGWIEMD